MSDVKVKVTPSPHVKSVVAVNPALKIKVDDAVDWNSVTNKPSSINEMLSGIDGTNTVFTTTYPFSSLLIGVYLNGLKLSTSHYTVTLPNQIELDEAPLVGDILEVDYIK